jgi:cytochrome c biogenesis protein CcdA
MHYFAEDALVEVSPWHFRSSRGSRPSRHIPVEKARDTLTRLANDASPKVRFEALLSLRLHGETVDPATLVRAIGSFADMERPAYRLSAAIGDGELLSDDEIRAYLPVLERAERRYSSLGKLRARIREDEADESASISYRPRHEPRAEAASNVVAGARSGAATVRLAYFWRAGCRECEVASRVLDQVRRVFPHLIVEAYDMGQMSAMRLNEALCRRFEVPEEDRLVAPAMFTTAGFLIRDRIAFTRLGDLVERSAGLPEADWAAIPKAALDEAGTAIETRFEAMTFAVVMGNGLLDGVNPCAFATIVFLLSYLQVAKRTRRQILAVGAAFVVAVFATYYALGFGFAEAIKRSLLIQRAGHALDVAMAAVLVLLVVLNARDGVLCLGGRMSEMSLQLPGVLKSAIHAAIRRQVRQSHMVLAASIAGVVVSLLELACTGQVYAPTVMYVLRQDPSAAKAHVLLFCYNLAFVVPLVVVFALAFGGVTSARMSGWLRRHAAAVKFATAGLFAVMLVLILLR